MDEQGRLVSGAPDDVRAVLEREQKRQVSRAYEPLARAAANVAAGVIGWAVGDFNAGGVHVLTALRGADGSTPYISSFCLQLVPDAQDGVLLRGRGTFADPGAAAECRERIRALAKGAMPLLPAVDVGNLLGGHQPWKVEGNDLCLELRLGPDKTGMVLRLAAEELGQMHQARKKLAQAMDYENDLRLAEAALADGKIGKARAAIASLKKNPLADKRLAELESEAATRGQRAQVGDLLKSARKLVVRDDLGELHKPFMKALELEPADMEAQRGAAAARLLQAADAALRQADKLLRANRPDDAYAELSTAANALAQDPRSPVA